MKAYRHDKYFSFASFWVFKKGVRLIKVPGQRLAARLYALNEALTEARGHWMGLVCVPTGEALLDGFRAPRVAPRKRVLAP